MKALIIGATGATGKDLLSVLLNDPSYTAVVIFVRRPSGLVHARLTEIITDFDNPETVAWSITGDILFCCLGTTLKAAGTKENQLHIDYEIPSKFAVLAKANGVSKVVLLSAYGASSSSKVFYSQLKGKLEETITSLAFKQLVIFRPGLLLRTNTDRWGERASAAVLNFLNKLGLIRKFRPLPTVTLAEKMAKAPGVLAEGKHIIELEKIFGF